MGFHNPANANTRLEKLMFKYILDHLNKNCIILLKLKKTIVCIVQTQV